MPISIASEIAFGAVVFVSTNIDDIFLLAAFFADPRMRTRAIVLGQYAGIAALILASALVALLALAVPDAWVALLGVVPLLLGLQKLWSLRRPRRDEDDDEPIGAREVQSPGAQMLAVAGVTIANGGDNLGAYIPLFAANPAAVAIHAVTFLVLTGALCVVARGAVRNRLWANAVRRHAPLALALVLIALGLWILAGARELVGL